ncbi:MAG TPA: alanine racemase [Ktedonobacteraceae bacterium]|nr:alanine racemase [Ktedonobacteraceae bacterium]
MALIGCPVSEIDTPTLLVELPRLEANIQRFADMAVRAGVKLRPHCKTHKTLEIAHRQLAAGAGGLTCAKLGEAEVYAAAGISDLFVAYPVIGREKARRAAELAQRCKLIVGVESAIGVQQLSQAANSASVVLSVRLELDSGLRRTGVAPEQAEELCRLILGAPALHLDGIFTFRGASFPGAPSRERAELGRLEGEWMVAQAQRLRAAGIPIEAVSVGSTPTAEGAARVPGVTEVRPGTYVFFDRMTTRAGVNAPDEIALSILATVVSRPAPDIAIIDAGSKTFCGDVIPANAGLEGYGATIDGRSGIVERMNEEHGIVRLASDFAPAIGDKLAFFSNHVCTSVNLSDEIVVVQQGRVQAIWPIAARGRRQ